MQGLMTRTDNPYLLDPAQFEILAAALGDTPQTLHSLHLLRRHLCRAYVLGPLSQFQAAVVQAVAWPEEPTSFGSDAGAVWEILQRVPDWDCVVVDEGVAAPLGAIMEAEVGSAVRYLDDVYHTLTQPVAPYRHPSVRELVPADLALLEAAPLELRASLWESTAALLTEGVVACAIIEGEIVATALVSGSSGGYADVGVYTCEAYRRQGLATAAASLVARRVQSEGRTPVWSAGGTNAASLRVAQKLGFKEVSRRRYVIPEGRRPV
jgi:RimJ/RimL family protein N-acetyltransferase